MPRPGCNSEAWDTSITTATSTDYSKRKHQPVNAEQVARLGLGKVLDYKSITPAILKDTAFAVMKDETVKKNLQDIQKQIANAPGNAGAVKIIEAYYHRGAYKQ